MAKEILAPGVHIETVMATGRPIMGVSTSTGVLLGEAMRGVINKPILITSWQDYIRVFARGLESPFIREADLAYAVNGFFQNGGRRLYVMRVGNMRDTNNRPLQAISSITNEQSIRAKDEGIWGNDLLINIEKNNDGLDPNEELFNILVHFKGERVEVWRGFSNNPERRNYFERINSQSEFIEFHGEDKIIEGSFTFKNGNDGARVSDIDYLQAFDNLHDLPDRNMIAIPGQTSRPVLRGLLDWCAIDNRTFPILEMPLLMTTQQARDERRELGSATRGAIYLPWFKVLDPLSPSGEPRICPPSGHLMGVFARISNERGVHKAPAGVEAQVRGIVDIVQVFNERDSEILNPASVNIVMQRPNFGIVIWGTRTLSSDTTMLYVSDQRLNSFIKQSLEEGTQWAVFEPNDSNLWSSLRITCQEFLQNLWSNGALFGTSADEAFFVVCDESNNTQETISQGLLFVDIGYAPVKPAEFIVLRIAHSMRSND